MPVEEKSSAAATSKLPTLRSDLPDTDVEIQVEETIFKVHKHWLKLNCKYFETMFADPWVESRDTVAATKRIELKGHPVHKVGCFLSALYDTFNLESTWTSEDVLLVLLEMSTFFAAEMMQARAASELAKYPITWNNVENILKQAIEGDPRMRPLREKCHAFLKKGFAHISHTHALPCGNTSTLDRI
ncbi:uncharacterized protein EV422DRAFT_339355 [Fimicolochytrium jonesii]|uniref:uncharacterized protein n=1 Tax=Fimicolochytrium jonesii TaxID=1396493 RepID=UPI0022FEAF07|nr:uncharacterized protein EV422DRAFT_339355 [Fimicolochytrium jonesii]KAI8815875.1 hypothetical protein EV422DRAFT_339355 [Fimicolochytrium jonesii]